MLISGHSYQKWCPIQKAIVLLIQRCPVWLESTASGPMEGSNPLPSKKRKLSLGTDFMVSIILGLTPLSYVQIVYWIAIAYMTTFYVAIFLSTFTIYIYSFFYKYCITFSSLLIDPYKLTIFFSILLSSYDILQLFFLSYWCIHTYYNATTFSSISALFIL